MEINFKDQSFWAIVLIVVGVVLLFGNLGSLVAVLLIAFGAGLILVKPDVQEGVYKESIGDAVSAYVDLNLSLGESVVSMLADSANLIEADVVTFGTIDFHVSGDTEKRVRLSQGRRPMDWINSIYGSIGMAKRLRWDVGLSPDVPLDLRVQGGAGKATLDLGAAQLTGLWVQGGVGEMAITLPASDDHYAARVNGGVGEFNVRILDGADLDLDVGAGVGEVTIDLPLDAEARITARMGLGELNVPKRFAKIEGQDHLVGGAGVWETPGYAEASRRITIIAQGGVGELNFR